MNKFLRKVLIFLIMPVIFILLADTYLRNKNSLYKEKYRGVVTNKEKVQILILGNSHANYGVDPAGFDDYAYNLANVNQSFYFDKRITLKVLNELEHLKYVLISADYHSLHFSSQGARNAWSYFGNGIRYKNEDYLFEQLSPSLFAYSPKVTLSFLKRDIVNLLNHNGKGVNFPVQKGVDLLDTVNQGFIGYTGSDYHSFNKKKYKERATVFNEKVKNNEELADVQHDLEDFIELLQKKRIIPVLYTTPTFSDYNEFLDSLLVKKEKNRFQNLSKKYEVPYWDFMDSDIFQKEMFYDEDHLNKRGAFKFASILNDSLKQL